MNLMFLNPVRRMLFLRRKAAPASSVISITEPTAITAADSGKTYSLDSELAAIILPPTGELSEGWTITVQCTVTGRFVTVDVTQIGLVLFCLDSADYDGASLDSTDAKVTIETQYNGTYMYFNATTNSGTVTGHWD